MNSHGLPPPQGLYDPRNEHDACGIGAVVNISGRREHGIIERGREVLLNLQHRGAAGADESTGDGAGILIQLPLPPQVDAKRVLLAVDPAKDVTWQLLAGIIGGADTVEANERIQDLIALGVDIREHHFSTERDVLTGAQQVFMKANTQDLKPFFSFFGPVYQVGNSCKISS